MMSQQIRESEVINKAFICDFINISTSRSMAETGKYTITLIVKKFFRFCSSCISLLSKLITHRYDLCYFAITCHGVGFLKDAPFVLLAKLFGKKVVIHQHNKGMSGCIDRQPYKTLIPFCYKGAKVILLSERLYSDIEKVVKREDVLICPNGIRRPEHLLNHNYSRQNAIPRLLFLSNLMVSKGVLVLLDALEILKDKGCSFVCDFVGGETKDINAVRFAQEVKKRGLDEIVIYHGEKYGADKEEYWKRADIFVFPSLNEAFGLVALEAMEYSLPIVASNEGGIPEVVHDNENGFLVEKGNANALADSIEKFLNDEPLRRKMGNNGHQLLLDKFTAEKFENRMRECLMQSMAER
jgi:glycosyltransferase involved in cell wall biosynthesis